MKALKDFTAKKKKKKILETLSFLNIINLPLTQNSCLCCTHQRIRIPLLLKKEKKKSFPWLLFSSLPTPFFVALFNF